jgi:DNA-binding NtrC family response regulator
LHREKKLPLRRWTPRRSSRCCATLAGNVRELENVVERLLTFSPKVHQPRARGTGARSRAGGDRRAAGRRPRPESHAGEGRGELLQKALRTARNKSEAARLLRIDRTWFLRLLKKHHLS